LARRILLADDSVTAQNMGRRILTDAGYEVLTVNNGSAALKKIAEHKPDLIVLDVYMPGYGGLEVCQRVKESSETRQIPVLLTVGKLEPFKQDEARRVGADAFIIKPFEATELLTVLTRLEDKIVAQPQQKTGRFAKALAAVEESDRFGDKETGWKNRLTIPRPGAKPRAEEEAPEAVASAPAQPGAAENLPSELGASQPFDAVRPVEPSRDFERPIPAGLPADITPEEIAAITAAAASFGSKPEATEALPEPIAADSVASRETAPVEVSSPEIASPEVSPEVPSSEISQAQACEPEAIAATLNTSPEVAPQAQLDVPAEVQQVPAEAEAMAVSEPAKVEDVPAAAAVEAASETTTSEAQISEPEKPAGNDAEVMAAIASLAPSNGHASEGVQPSTHGSNGTAQGVAAYASTVSAAASGPRWIAEAVAVGAEELKLALEQEMELAHAERAVAQSTDMATATAVETASSTEVASVAEVGVAVPVESVSSPVAESIAAESPIVETAIVESSMVESSNVESATVASSIGESLSVESSLNETSTIEASAAASPIIESSPVESSLAQEAEPAPLTAATAREEAAFAAAASVGATAEYPLPSAAASLASTAPDLPQSTPVAPAAEPQREAELAAAWKNWKQIRESMVESQPASPPAEPPAVQASSPAQEEEVSSTQPAPAEAVAEVKAATADAPEESTAIASIVDTMLAELRPKLVAEIAKKMSSEKDRKEKDKDRDKDRDRDKKKKK
jgi:CheY-like chemotaxis protein